MTVMTKGEKTMYSKEFLESLGLDPAVYDPDCESVSTKPWWATLKTKIPYSLTTTVC